MNTTNKHMDEIPKLKLDLNNDVLREIDIKLMDHSEINMWKGFQSLNLSQSSHKSFNERKHGGEINGLLIDNGFRDGVGGKEGLSFRINEMSKRRYENYLKNGPYPKYKVIR